jgi:hypothetical protein
MPLRPVPAAAAANNEDLSESSDLDSDSPPPPREVVQGWTRFLNDHLNMLTAGHALAEEGDGTGGSAS